MGFAAIVGAVHLFLKRRQPATGPHDVEKAEQQMNRSSDPRAEEQDGEHEEADLEIEEELDVEEEDGHEVEDEADPHTEGEAEEDGANEAGEVADEQPEGDNSAYGQRKKQSRRFRRFATFESTFSGSTFTRTLTQTTTNAARNWLQRVRSFVLPRYPNPAELEAYVPTYRSSPIISAILIPFSILLEIPGLTERWYIMTYHNQTVQTRPNSAILNAGMAISLACAVFANICLIVRFAERSVKLATLSCIMFLTIHDAITITTVTVFAVVHRYDDGFTYGQAFWLTLCSTIASTVTNITLIIDYARVSNFAQSGSGLTRKQRSLVILVIVLLMYLALGALINSELLSVSYINGLYYSTISIETIGFGDIVPHNTGGRVFICGYIAIGMIILGIVISITRDTVLEGLEVGYRKRLRNLQARRREARRFRHWQRRWRDAVAWRLHEKGEPLWVPDSQTPDGVRFVGLGGKAAGSGQEHWLKRFLKYLGLRDPPPMDPSVRPIQHVPGHPRGMHLNINPLTGEELETAALEAGVPLDQFVEISPARRIASGGLQPAGPGPLPQGGWPSQVRTPTDAQLGRMAAVLTKVALAASGRDISLPGPSAQDQTNAQSAVVEEQDERIEANRWRELLSPPGVARAVSMTSTCRPDPTSYGGYHFIPVRWGLAAAAELKKVTKALVMRVEADMADEEKNANVVKLALAWTVFLMFWLAGAAIFSATERWSYGIALYFCWVSFTTTGYGDYAPETPAGRSIFVVWALFGVGTLTILVAVIEDAGSTRYKDALHSRAFDRAVTKYRKKAALQSAKVPRAEYHLQRAFHAGDMMIQNKSGNSPPVEPSSLESTAARLEEAQAAAQHALETLPVEIIRRARTFHDYMQFFAGSKDINETDGERPQTDVPRELKKLLDDILKSERVNERVKREILQDDDAKHTLFLLSIERALRKMIESAERALQVLADRNALLALYEDQRSKTSRTATVNGGPRLSEYLVEQEVINEGMDSSTAESEISQTAQERAGSDHQSDAPSLSLSPLPSPSQSRSNSPSERRSQSPPAYPKRISKRPTTHHLPSSSHSPPQ